MGDQMTARELRQGRRLFHFTSLCALPDVLQDGITRGEVALGPTDYRQAPSLTTSMQGRAQTWARGSALDKTKVRLAVAVPDGETRLEWWPEVCRRLNVPRRYQRALDPTGQGKFWFVFWGAIPPDWIRAAEVRGEGDDYGPPLAGEVLAELLAKIRAERERAGLDRTETCPVTGAAWVTPTDPDSWLLDAPKWVP
jgi:hypothetical protein